MATLQSGCVGNKNIREDFLDGLATRQVQLKALGYFQVTPLTSAAGLPTIPVGATIATVICETQSVRWRDDGQNPTATVGMLLPVNTYLTFENADLTAIKFIQTAVSATLNVVYYVPQGMP